MVRHSFSRASRSFSAVVRRVWSSRCSSLLTTCWVENTMSIRFLPNAPDKLFFSSARYIMLSSWVIMLTGASTHEMISRLLFT